MNNFDGKFRWIKLGTVPAASLQSLGKARAISVTINFPHPVALKKDSRGFAWLTMIIADQGSDWKWNQTRSSGSVPISNNTVNAGSYSVSVPLPGIPHAVLAGKQQTISVGVNASGLVSHASFTVVSIRGR